MLPAIHFITLGKLVIPPHHQRLTPHTYLRPVTVCRAKCLSICVFHTPPASSEGSMPRGYVRGWHIQRSNPSAANPSSNSLPLTDICSVASVQHPAYHSSWHLHRNRRNIASTCEGVESSKRTRTTTTAKDDFLTWYLLLVGERAKHISSRTRKAKRRRFFTP